jgi:probable HAF family extracellular repeat protein
MAVAINEGGQVVGWSTTTSNEIHAFRWSNGTMIDLGTLGGRYSRATAINDAGQIAGTSTAVSGTSCHDSGLVTLGCRAFLWDGAMHNLGTLGGDFSRAVAITPQGQVAGHSMTAAGEIHAFYWNGTAMIDLGTLGGNDSRASAVNSQGHVVGSSKTADGTWHAFRWDGSMMHDLGSLGGSGGAVDINDGGQVTGSTALTNSPTAETHAFLWDGTMRDLGTGGGPSSFAAAINNRGEIVGTTYTMPGNADHGDQPFIWNGSMRTLVPFGGADGSASDINESGHVVGTAALPSETCTLGRHCHAFFWDGQRFYDLGDLGHEDRVSSARDVNDHRQIVGWSYTPSRNMHAVLWTVR